MKAGGHAARGLRGGEVGGDRLLPQSEPREDVGRHVQGVGRGRRDAGVGAGRGQGQLRQRRVVEAVDDVVRDSRMIGRAGQHGVEDVRRLLLHGVRLVGGGRRSEQGQAVEDRRLLVRRVARVDLLHRAREGGRSCAVIQVVGPGVERLHRGHVVPLARRGRAGGRGLLGFVEPARQLRRAGGGGRVGRRPDGMEQGHGDAPVRHRAGGIRGQHVLERALRLLVGERVQESDRALELRPRRRRAGDGEVHRPQLLARRDRMLVRFLGESGEGGDGEERRRRDHASPVRAPAVPACRR